MGAILALFMAAAPASPAPGPAKLVELYVVVTEDGRRLTDLVKEDFDVFESGQRQRVTRFVPEFGTANDKGGGRRIVFVVDDNHMEPNELLPVKLALQRFLEGTFFGPGDEAAVVVAGRDLEDETYPDRYSTKSEPCPVTSRITPQGLVRVPNCPPQLGHAAAGPSVPRESTSQTPCPITVQDRGGLETVKAVACAAPEFTSDRRALRQAVDRLVVPGAPRPYPDYPYPSLLTEYQSILIRGGDREALALALDENKGKEPPNQVTPDLQGTTRQIRAADIVRWKARTIADLGDRMTAITFASLQRYIRSLRSLPGRKAVVVFSSGFFRASPGASTWTWGDPVVRPIADAAVRAGAVVYVVNTRRSAVSPTPGAGAVEPDVRSRIERRAMDAARDGQSLLAELTGGLAFPDADEMGQAIERAFEDGGNWYRLEYERRPPAVGEFFRRVVVRVPTRFSRLRIRAAAGYNVGIVDRRFTPLE